MYGFNEHNIKIWQSFVLSLTSGVISSVVTNPLDVVKIRMQVQRAELQKGETLIEGRYGYSNIFQGVYRVAMDEGVFGLFRGCYARILMMSFNSCLSLTLLDSIRGVVIKFVDKK